MQKTSLKQKLLLNCLGLFLAVIFLEIGLRIAGVFVLYLQERHNHLTFNPNEYRILCLGESTTALGGEDSYPSQLEEKLNTQSRQTRFTVINKGIISTNTNYILSHVERNLDFYKPQLVIVMMGINDKAYLHDPYKSLWWENIKLYIKDLKVYKLAHLLYEHITHRIKEINSPAEVIAFSPPDESNYLQAESFLKLLINKCIERFSVHMLASFKYQKNQQFAESQNEKELAKQSIIEASLICTELARRYRLEGSFQEAQAILEEATKFYPHYTDIYQEWGELYMAQEKSAEAVKAFQAALTFDPKNSDALLGLAHAYHQEQNEEAFLVYAGYLQIKPQDYWGYIEFARWLRENKHYDLAQVYLSHAIELGPDYDQAYVDLGQVLEAQGQYNQEEAFYLKEISLHSKSPRLYQILGQLYHNQGKEDLSQAYFQKASVHQVAEYYPATLVNYSLLLNKILNRHIKVVVMQYPLQDIATLKNYLGNRKGVTYVENRQNFKQALTKDKYNHYFKDNFAYNFGHCTRAGNELIARHLAEIITKKILVLN